MRSCTLAVVTLRATPRAENIASNTTYCIIHLITLQDATFQTGSTHAAKTVPPAPREMVRHLYRGHSYQQLTVVVWKNTEALLFKDRIWAADRSGVRTVNISDTRKCKAIYLLFDRT
jgi:hypothetical protein